MPCRRLDDDTADIRLALGDSLSEDEQAHLETCADCQASVKARQETLAFIEQELETIGSAEPSSTLLSAVRHSRPNRRARLVAWWVGAAATIAAGISFILVAGPESPREPKGSTVMLETSDSPDVEAPGETAGSELTRPNSLLRTNDDTPSTAVPAFPSSPIDSAGAVQIVQQRGVPAIVVDSNQEAAIARYYEGWRTHGISLSNRAATSPRFSEISPIRIPPIQLTPIHLDPIQVSEIGSLQHNE